MKKPEWITFGSINFKYTAYGLISCALLACSQTAGNNTQSENHEMHPSAASEEITLMEDADVEYEQAPLASKEVAAPVRQKRAMSPKGKMEKKISQFSSNMGAGAMQDQMIMPPQERISPPETTHNTEEYQAQEENSFKSVMQEPLSTFSIDVDNASYSNVRRYLSRGNPIPKGSVRIEEMINYFDYQYPQPTGKHPFSVVTEVAQSPWDAKKQLVHIGIQGKSLDYNELKASNLVFLIDASGSMRSQNKLPLLKSSLKKLLAQLQNHDRVAIVAYAGAAGLVLPSTPASQRETILNALDRVNAGGSTAGGQGIKLAYEVALQNLIPGGNNRVILATDGDFNVGVSSSAGLVDLIKQKRDQDIFLTICGFGMGNYKDGRMEQISNAGNGNFFYIDNEKEATKVFVREMRANLFTIAKDVKIQIEFNPNQVAAYRLVGYVNRKLQNEDFNNDKIDAGELGAGHTVTALYEIIPASENFTPNVDPLQYQKLKVKANSQDLMTLKLRYKHPKQTVSQLIKTRVSAKLQNWKNTSPDYRFSAAVAAFGMKLSESKFDQMSWNEIRKLAQSAIGQDAHGDRREFISLINQAQGIYPERVAIHQNENTNYPSRTVH